MRGNFFAPINLSLSIACLETLSLQQRRVNPAVKHKKKMAQTNLSFQVFLRKHDLPKEMEKNYFEMKLHNFKTQSTNKIAKKRKCSKGKTPRCHRTAPPSDVLNEEKRFIPIASVVDEFCIDLVHENTNGLVFNQPNGNCDTLERYTMHLLSELEHEIERSFNTHVVNNQTEEMFTELVIADPTKEQKCLLILSDEAIRELQGLSR